MNVFEEKKLTGAFYEQMHRFLCLFWDFADNSSGQKLKHFAAKSFTL